MFYRDHADNECNIYTQTMSIHHMRTMIFIRNHFHTHYYLEYAIAFIGAAYSLLIQIDLINHCEDVSIDPLLKSF